MSAVKLLKAIATRAIYTPPIDVAQPRPATTIDAMVRGGFRPPSPTDPDIRRAMAMRRMIHMAQEERDIQDALANDQGAGVAMSALCVNLPKIDVVD